MSKPRDGGTQGSSAIAIHSPGTDDPADSVGATEEDQPGSTKQ